jgi:hypothetical protein
VLGYLQVTTWVYQRSPKSIPGDTLYDLQIFVGYLGCSQHLFSRPDLYLPRSVQAAAAIAGRWWLGKGRGSGNPR